MQSAYSTFVGKLEESARIHLRRQLEASTSSFTLHSLMQRMEQEGGGLADTSLYNNTMDLGGDSPGDVSNDEDDDEENGDPGALLLCHFLCNGRGQHLLEDCVPDAFALSPTFTVTCLQICAAEYPSWSNSFLREV